VSPLKLSISSLSIPKSLKSARMEDTDIFDLATHVLSSISGDLANGNYTESGGTLDFAWSPERRVSAWAESPGDPNIAPNHRVVICYELALRLYRDIEDYHLFGAGALLEEPYETIFKDFKPKPRLPSHISKLNSIRNMFIGALTWVFFHEIGHLTQEHGYIRKKFGGRKLETRIEDCESDGSSELGARASLISHVTEFAADVEAVQWCIQELYRHFLPEKGNGTEHDLKEFQSNLFLMVAGISCALYRFNGDRAVDPTEHPVGSHPTPVRRLEVCLPNVYEKLDFGGIGHEVHRLNRSELVYICTGAADSAGFFWLRRQAVGNEIPAHFLTKGLLRDPFKASYWAAIIRAWDEMEPEIRKIRRFGSPIGVLSFTSEFRSQIFKGGNAPFD